jgi:mRNA interferase RelE/StbE
MTFDVLVDKRAFQHIPAERQKTILEALKILKDPYPGGDRQEIKGKTPKRYRLKIGKYRAFYTIDEINNKVIVYDILTAEQAHSKYNR